MTDERTPMLRAQLADLIRKRINLEAELQSVEERIESIKEQLNEG